LIITKNPRKKEKKKRTPRTTTIRFLH